MASNGSGNTRARLTTGAVVLAAGLAVGLSIFAVNRSSVRPTEATAAAPVSSQVQSSAVTTTPAPTSAPVTSTPVTSAPAASPAPTTVPQAKAAPVATASYTVKPGDNLSVIAAWFKLNGYGDLYEANKGVLGANPNLIYPGQTISLTANGVSLTTAPR